MRTGAVRLLLFAIYSNRPGYECRCAFSAGLVDVLAETLVGDIHLAQSSQNFRCALINEGYVYIAESPLYEITTKDRTYFAYTEPEKAAFLKEIGEKKYTIQRSKGLGENDPEMMWLTTMNPESRRLIKVLPTDVEETARVFDLLLGDNLAGRKEHIAEHGAEYLDDLDVS